jgi:hypothetical protein
MIELCLLVQIKPIFTSRLFDLFDLSPGNRVFLCATELGGSVTVLLWQDWNMQVRGDFFRLSFLTTIVLFLRNMYSHRQWDLSRRRDCLLSVAISEWLCLCSLFSSAGLSFRLYHKWCIFEAPGKAGNCVQHSISVH